MPDPSCKLGKEAMQLGYITAINERRCVNIPIGTRIAIGTDPKTGKLCGAWRSGPKLGQFEAGYFERWQVRYDPSRNP